MSLVCEMEWAQGKLFAPNVITQKCLNTSKEIYLGFDKVKNLKLINLHGSRLLAMKFCDALKKKNNS